jgi:hypothetical protein
MVSLLSLILFSSLQSLVSKVSYGTFYNKHCKEGDNCHNSFLGYSPKFYPFFLLKIKKYKIKNNSKKTGDLTKAS